MSRKNSKQKGSKFEGEICKQFSLWWTNNKRDDIFWKTAGSGARATVRSKQGLRTADSYGDMMAIDEIGKPFTNDNVVSIKRGYTGKKGSKSLQWIDILDLIDTPGKFKSPVLIDWISELDRDIKAGNRTRGFIVFRRDRKESVIVMNRETLDMLSNKSQYIKEIYGSIIGIAIKDLNDLIAMRLESFFSWCKPEMLGAKRMIKRRMK